MATILIVDDDAALRDGLAETVTDLGHAALTAASGREAIGMVSAEIDAILLDLRMPGIDGIETLRRLRADGDAPPVIVLTAYASPENTIQAMRLGAFDHLVKPIGRDALRELIERLPPRRHPQQDHHSPDESGLIGTSEAMRRVQKTIGLAADADATVLIRGETGTGKEQMARHAHAASRRAGSFVAVNCAALPDSLIEAELFGYTEGAFTGARKGGSVGLFKEADGGTLFLDEIGDMPVTLQAVLLRFLDDWTVRPVGGSKREVDVLLVSATNANLDDAIAKGRFRSDLLFRLNTLEVTLLPLRERTDFAELARHLMQKIDPSIGLSEAAIDRLAQRDWDGNIRELRNVLARLSLHETGPVIDAAAISSLLGPGRPARVPPMTTADEPAPADLHEIQRAHVLSTYTETGHNISKTARRLGISRNTVYRALRGKPD